MADEKVTTNVAADAARSTDKVAADKTRNDAAVEGATSVADAVKRFSDAVVADLKTKNMRPYDGDFDVATSSKAGGRIELRGEGFGTNGTLKVGGHQVKTTEWGSQHIIGNLPADVKNGDAVVVHVDEKTSQTAYIGGRKL